MHVKKYRHIRFKLNIKNLIRLFFLTILFFTISIGFSQESMNVKSKKKTGFGLGAIPVFAFDSDVGIKTGLAANIFHYGNGEDYPKYNHSALFKWYRTTKGSNLSQFIYDSEKLISNIRITSEISYISDKALDFYGFNGSKSHYNPLFIDESLNNQEYISKIYYKHERKLLRIKSDFQSSIKNTDFRWLLGFSHYNIKLKEVDINEINTQKSIKEILPDTATLFQKYIEWGIITEDEKNGGSVNLLKSGLIYDSRDNECNCNTGFWTEALVLIAPSFLGNQSNFGKILITHRQYFPIKLNRLTFAYRLSYQTKLWGTMPFYMLPFFFDSRRTEDGLGGAKNLRGVLRNRIVSDGFIAGTIELRWKCWSFNIFKQDIYLSINTFSDATVVTKEYEFNTDFVTASYGNTLKENLNSLNYSDNRYHYTYGLGIYIGMNDNFIISTDYGRAVSSQDGESGLYIGLDFIF